MSLALLARRSRVVYHSGVRYLVRSPSLETVQVLLAEFGVHVAVLAREHASAGTFDRNVALRLLMSDRERAVRVLATCVETDADPADERAWPLALLGEAVLAITDAAGFLRNMDLVGLARAADPGGAPEQDEDEPGDWASAGVVKLALLFGCAPWQVVRDWPYDSLPAIWDALKLLGEVKSDEDDDYAKLVREAAQEHTKRVRGQRAD